MQRVGTVNGTTARRSVKPRNRAFADLGQLYLALWPVIPVRAAGSVVGLPTPSVARTAGRDRLLTLQRCPLRALHMLPNLLCNATEIRSCTCVTGSGPAALSRWESWQPLEFVQDHLNWRCQEMPIVLSKP